VGDLRRLRGRHSGDPASGADALKQFYLWRQDQWNIVPQALITAALTLIGGTVLSILTTGVSADDASVTVALVVALALAVIAAASLIWWRSWVSRQYVLAIQTFLNLP
jgi:hypothetical protein